MATLKCNQCKAKFTYKDKGYTEEAERDRIIKRFGVTHSGGKYYCDYCARNISHAYLDNYENLVKYVEYNYTGIEVLPSSKIVTKADIKEVINELFVDIYTALV